MSNKYTMRKIAQILDGVIISTYSSITEAAKAVGIANTGISKCLHGRRNTAAGFSWCIHEETILLNEDIERWVVGYEGHYTVDKMGNIYSYKLGGKSVMIPHISNGYKRITLHKGRDRSGHLVHRLVAKAFLVNPNNYDIVNHIDGNKLNNTVTNLEWCTSQHNCIHALQTGLKRKPTPATVRVVSISNDGKRNTYSSIAAASAQTGIPRSSIISCCKGRCKTAGNHKWIYADGENMNNNRRVRAVYCISNGTQTFYESMSEASRATRANLTSIGQCCRGIHKTAGGYEWRFADVEQ